MSTSEKDTSLVLGSLQEKGDYFSKQTVVEKKRAIDLQDAIEHITNETGLYRDAAKTAAIGVMNLHILTPNPAYSRADGVNVAKDAAGVTMKVLIVLEGKLNKLLQRKSEVLKSNKGLKTDISHFRRLRIQTDIQHAKNEEILRETKANIERMLSDSTAVVEERDRLLEKRDALERSNVEEQVVFQEEYEQLGTFIRAQNEALEEALLKERKEEMQEKKAGLKAALLAATPNGNSNTIKSSSIKKKSETETIPRLGRYSLQEEIDMAKQVQVKCNYYTNVHYYLSFLILLSCRWALYPIL